jgi:hypothetical protein
MNIFILDLDPKKCALYHVDKHATKMCVEYAQLLCGVHWVTESEYLIPYKLSHKNHPCSIWARECIENYVWLCDLGLSLCEEYTYRYGKRHKSQDVIEWALLHKPNLMENGDITPFALAMPDECKRNSPVDSYRLYYIKHKVNISTWKKRDIPNWFKESLFI